MIIVVEPGIKSLETARRIIDLSSGLGIRRIVGVANKVRSEADAAFIREFLSDVRFAGTLPFFDSIVRADQGKGPLFQQEILEHVRKIAQEILS